jgi:hypothetical protein
MVGCEMHELRLYADNGKLVFVVPVPQGTTVSYNLPDYMEYRMTRVEAKWLQDKEDDDV